MKRTACLGVVLFAVSVPAVSAHEGGPYLSIVRAIRPAVPGLKIVVLERDQWLRLTNETDKSVFVIGYDGERYLRIRPGGPVDVNVKSPENYVNADGSVRSPLPSGVSAKARPVWQELSRFAVAEWRDRRVHGPLDTAPTNVVHTSRKTRIHDWSVPLLVGNKPVRAVGTLYWAPQNHVARQATPPDPKSSAGPLIAVTTLLVTVLVAVAAVFLVRRGRGRATEEGATR